MQKSLCIFLGLLLLGCAFGATNQTISSSNITNNSSSISKTNTERVGVTNSGNIPLYKNSQGFYAGVDLIRDDSSWPFFGSNTVAMQLGLYTSQTLLVSSCLSFNKYDCQKYQCTQYIYNTRTTQYPYFTATGNIATANAYLDYSHWSLSDYALIASSCSNGGQNSIGSSTSGILGLGLNTQYNNYFTSSPVFSLYLKSLSNMDGYLMFQKDLRYASSSQSVATLSADQNWISYANGYLYVGSYTVSLYSLSLIFDLYSDSIGLPSTIYSNVLQLFSSSGASCYGNYRPTCSYGNYLSKLPTVKIQLSYPNSGYISIPPQVYVANYSSYSNYSYIYSFTLNMKALGPNLALQNYVTPSFNSTIILNADVLSQFYSVFDASTSTVNPTIYLYTATNSPPVPGSTPWWGFVSGGVVLAIIICACCRCCCRPKLVNPVQVTTITTVQAPLILNDQTTYVQPSPVVVNYAYPQAVYSQQPQAIIPPAPQVYYNTPAYQAPPNNGYYQSQ